MKEELNFFATKTKQTLLLVVVFTLINGLALDLGLSHLAIISVFYSACSGLAFGFFLGMTIFLIKKIKKSYDLNND